MPETSLPVEFLFSLTAHLAPPAVVSHGPQGTRVIVGVTGGEFAGPRMKGVVVGPGGDWVTMRADGSAQLDVRLQLQTDDGATILMQYKGVLAVRGGETTIHTAPLFETGAEAYAWLNHVQAVAKGSTDGTAVRYDVYALA